MPLDKIKKEQVDISSIDKRYASQAAMILDQINQFDKFIYFDGTSYWEYLGTTVGDITDYRLFSFTIGNLDLEMLVEESDVVKFNRYGGYISGNDSPRSGTITYDFSLGILGSVYKMKYSNTTTPSFPTGSKVIAGYYAINVVNYFTFELINKTPGSEEVWVTISQE